MTAKNIRRAERAAAKAALSQAALQDAIRELHADGVSLRKIAEVVGMSHESVRRLIRSDQT